MSISSAPELELSLVSFLDQAPLQLDREGMKAREDGEMGGGWRLLKGRLLLEDCFVSESWLSMIILSHSNCPEGYIMVRKDRAGSPIGGSVAIICRNDWKVKALNVTDSLEFES